MAGAGYRDWVAGNIPTAAQFDTFLQEQTVMVFDDATDRNTQLSVVKAEGMTCYVLDENRYYGYDGTNWQRVGHTSSAGRTCLRARRAGTVQTIANGVIADISWDVEDQDTDAFITVPSTTITIPAGLGGLYSISFTVDDVLNRGAAVARIALSSGATFNFGTAGDNTTQRLSGGIVWDVAAASTVKLAVFNGSGLSANYTAAIVVARQSA